VDGAPTVALAREDDGFVHLRLETGVHEVVLEGPLPPDPAFTLQFAMPPRRLETQTEGWRIEGVRPDGSVDSSVQLLRQAGGAVQSLEASPWVEIHRFVDLGFPWKVRTEVQRLGPADRPLHLNVPLLPGESVTSDGFVVADGKVQVSLGRSDTTTSWLSSLEEADQLTFAAPTGVSWTETWEISCSPVFECNTEGFPPIAHVQDSGDSPLWRPWPGEQLHLSVHRPEAVPGQTLTIDQASVSYKEEPRFLTAKLLLDVRASQGGHLPIHLPPGAHVEQVQADHSVIPVQAPDGVVQLPLHPGKQSFEVDWQLPGAPGLWWKAPSLDLGAPAVNLRTTLTPPANTSLPLFSMSQEGPVAFWWARLAALLGIGLGMSKMAPLKRRSDWVLLCLGLHPLPWGCAVLLGGWWALRPEHLPASLRKMGRGMWMLAIPGVLGGLLLALTMGLSRSPDLLLSSGLSWTQDRGDLPTPWAIQLPNGLWKLGSVAWGLWMLSRMGAWAELARERMKG
jgi:hypothetical protein